MRYVALLRGINVGGHTVKMEALRRVFEAVGFGNVASYINSGNVFFDSTEGDRGALTGTIEAALEAALGYAVPTFLRTPAELARILERDPFAATEPRTDLRFCVTFTADPIPPDLPLPLASSKNDMEIVAVAPHEAFVVWHILAGRPPSGRFPPDVLPARNTTRFFHTLRKILAAATR